MIIFDLDGVLIDSKKIHYLALNEALNEVDSKYLISSEEQAMIYEGLPTREKLEILSLVKGLPRSEYERIWKLKQEYTAKAFASWEIDDDLVGKFKWIKDQGVFIGVASNSIRETLDTCLAKLGLTEYVDISLSNGDVVEPKPSPEIYLKCMKIIGVEPQNVAIFEDSFIGKTGALASGAHLIDVNSREDLTQERIEMAVEIAKSNYKKTINILMPMAGLGSRFNTAQFKDPKPLIEIEGVPMIAKAIESLGITGNYVFVVRKEHFDGFNMHEQLSKIVQDYAIVVIDEETEGAAVTALYAKEFIDNGLPLIIANSDQIVEWNGYEFIESMKLAGADGGIATFTASNPKWSYAEVNEVGDVVRVAEKEAISDIATVGIYYWRDGSEFVKYAEQMIDKNIQTNGEFYIAPVFNEAIADGKKIRTYAVDKMWGVGTPEDLQKYLNRNA